MTEQPRNLSGSEALDKAKEYAKEHPDQTKSAIDKLEETLNERTGGRFKDVIEKGGDYVEKEFGIPSDVSHNPSPDQAPTTPDDGQTPATDETSGAEKQLPPFGGSGT